MNPASTTHINLTLKGNPGSISVNAMPDNALCVLANRPIYELMREHTAKNKTYFFALTIDKTAQILFADGSYFVKYLAVYGKMESPTNRQLIEKGAFYKVNPEDRDNGTAEYFCSIEDILSNKGIFQHEIAAHDEDLENSVQIEALRVVTQDGLKTLKETNIDSEYLKIKVLYSIKQAAALGDSLSNAWLGQFFSAPPQHDLERAYNHFLAALEKEPGGSPLEKILFKETSRLLSNHSELHNKVQPFYDTYHERLPLMSQITLKGILEKNELARKSSKETFLDIPAILSSEEFVDETSTNDSLNSSFDDLEG